MKIFIVAIGFIFLSQGNAFSQTAKDSVAVYGNVQDSFTYETLRSARRDHAPGQQPDF